MDSAGPGMFLSNRFLFASSELDEVEHHLNSMLCPHRLIADNCRSIRFRQYAASLRRTDFSFIDYGFSNGNIRLVVPNFRDNVFVGLTLTGKCWWSQDGQRFELQPGTLAVLNPDRPLTATIADGWIHLNVRFTRAALHSALAAELGYVPVEPLTFRTSVVPIGQRTSGLVRMIRTICEDLNEEAPGFTQNLAERHIEQSLMCFFLSSFPHNYSQALAASAAAPKPYYVRRVMKLIASRAREPLTLADMVEASGVSARSLHAGFRRYLGRTPMNYLKEFRLDLAMRELREAAAQRRSVTDVALSCGFTHLSKFAADFRRRFGVSPSKVRSGTTD